MWPMASETFQLGIAAKTDDFHTEERDSLEGSLVILGLSYLGLVCLMFYVDYRMQIRRARKRLEAKRDAARLKGEKHFDGDEGDPGR